MRGVSVPTLPAEIAYSTLHGRFLLARNDGADADVRPDAAFAAGKVKFTPSVDRLRAIQSQSVVWLESVYEAPIAADGTFTIDLPATDSPDVSPTGWTYAVSVEITGRKAWTFTIDAPAGATRNIIHAVQLPGASPGVVVTQGAAGPGVQSISDDGAGTATFHLSDGRTFDVALPVGPPGPVYQQVIDVDGFPAYTADESTILEDYTGAAALQPFVNLTTDPVLDYSPTTDPWTTIPYTPTGASTVPDAPTDVISYAGVNGASLLYTATQHCMVRVWYRCSGGARVYVADHPGNWDWINGAYDGLWRSVDFPLTAGETVGVLFAHYWASGTGVSEVARVAVYALSEPPKPAGTVLYQPRSGTSTPSELWWAHSPTVSGRRRESNIAELILTGITTDDLRKLVSTPSFPRSGNYQAAAASPDASAPSVRAEYDQNMMWHGVKGTGYFFASSDPLSTTVGVYPWTLVSIAAGSSVQFAVIPYHRDPAKSTYVNLKTPAASTSNRVWNHTTSVHTPVTIHPGLYLLQKTGDVYSDVYNLILLSEPAQGDTGPRNVAASLDPIYVRTAFSTATIRRVGQMVTVSMSLTTAKAWGDTYTGVYTFPAGFKPASKVLTPVYAYDATVPPTTRAAADNHLSLLAGPGSTFPDWATLDLSFNFLTADPWPAFLPGTPA